LSSEVLFFKDFQDKTGVKMEVIRHGKYKSAVEPFLYNEMSDANREQITSFLTSIWDEILVDVSNSRNIPVSELNNIADNLLARNANLAKENNIIDEALYLDEYENKIKSALGIFEDDKLNVITIKDYIGTGKGRISSSASNKIAVIYAQGEIMYGKGNEDVIGQELIINALRKAKKSSEVKAIVLRVNSPGGSALASELIWREIEITKKVKPVVVSMGNYAASGGYYIAANANRIFAEPNTITGSIGVFGMLPNMNQLGKNIGINAEQVKTHANASGYSIFEPIDENYKSYALESIEKTYATFLKRVAEGRNMSTAQVDAMAQGRVWTGMDAKKLGLVDEIGGLEAAIKYAAKLGKTTSYRTENFPEYEKNFEDFLSNFTGIAALQTKEQLLKEQLGEEGFQMLEQIKRVKSRKGIQAMMPYELNIR